MHTVPLLINYTREGQLVANPKSMTVFEAGDRIGLIGDKDHLKAANSLVDEQPLSGQVG